MKLSQEFFSASKYQRGKDARHGPVTALAVQYSGGGRTQGAQVIRSQGERVRAGMLPVTQLPARGEMLSSKETCELRALASPAHLTPSCTCLVSFSLQLGYVVTEISLCLVLFQAPSVC